MKSRLVYACRKQVHHRAILHRLQLDRQNTVLFYRALKRKQCFVEKSIATGPGPAPARSERKKGARQGLGRTGERMASEALIGQGYAIVERNFRCRHGEIDLVAEHQDDLVFVEVKTRRGTLYGRPEEAVTPHKQRKLLEVAFYYLDLHDCAHRSWRIDVVAVQLSQSGRFEEIRVYQHAVTG